MKRTWFTFATLVSLGCDSEHHESAQTRPSEPLLAPISSNVPARLGATQTLSDLSVRFVSERDCAAVDANFPGRGMRVRGVELEVRNLTRHHVLVNPFYTHLVDAQGYVYTTSLKGCPPLLTAKNLGPAEVARGFVTFEIPQSVRRATLTFAVAGDGSEPPRPEKTARFRVEVE